MLRVNPVTSFGNIMHCVVDTNWLFYFFSWQSCLTYFFKFKLTWKNYQVIKLMMVIY